MEFIQEGSFLYVVGGYGYTNATASRKTFASLIAINVPAVINAVINGVAINNFFRQYPDNLFAVTGGQLKKINQTFYLIGGNRFDGNYNPMGGPTYTQVYTESIRKFKLADDGTNLTITHLPEVIDAANLHRRDYNAVGQILPDGSEGITVFSGVFQPTLDLPYLNCVNIDSVGHSVNNGFQQFYNHYHCANLALYDSAANEMHSVFFGGIAQYYDSMGVLVQDNNVPFVKTIARVTRDGSGSMAEYKLPVELPDYLGAGSEFIPLLSEPHFANHVFKLDDFTSDTTLVGHIYGGINSSAPNIFFTNTGTQSSASNVVFKVYIIRNLPVGLHKKNEQSVGTLKMMVLPNPSDGDFLVKFNLEKAEEVKISLFNASGKLLEEKVLKNLHAGENSFSTSLKEKQGDGVYFLSLETSKEKISRKIIVKH